ncbi:MAG: hypothetical protein HGA76_12470, partial [Candidatus Firestonebacteria bacterium]|nr:hypothetical protein [Candidatus Firestonebacteria bacterium]
SDLLDNLNKVMQPYFLAAFTSREMANDPKLKALPAKMAILEKEIKDLQTKPVQANSDFQRLVQPTSGQGIWQKNLGFNKVETGTSQKKPDKPAVDFAVQSQVSSKQAALQQLRNELAALKKQAAEAENRLKTYQGQLAGYQNAVMSIIREAMTATNFSYFINCMLPHDQSGRIRNKAEGGVSAEVVGMLFAAAPKNEFKLIADIIAACPPADLEELAALFQKHFNFLSANNYYQEASNKMFIQMQSLVSSILDSIVEHDSFDQLDAKRAVFSARILDMAGDHFSPFYYQKELKEILSIQDAATLIKRLGTEITYKQRLALIFQLSVAWTRGIKAGKLTAQDLVEQCRHEDMTVRLSLYNAINNMRLDYSLLLDIQTQVLGRAFGEAQEQLVKDQNLNMPVIEEVINLLWIASNYERIMIVYQIASLVLQGEAFYTKNGKGKKHSIISDPKVLAEVMAMLEKILPMEWTQHDAHTQRALLDLLGWFMLEKSARAEGPDGPARKILAGKNIQNSQLIRQILGLLGPDTQRELAWGKYNEIMSPMRL